MPWRTVTVETERAQFVMEAQLGSYSHAELCSRHGISRQTGYKWLERHESEGWSGLADRSSRPHSCPHVTQAYVVERILEIRKLRGWGARKIWKKLQSDPAIENVPSIDTVHRVLARNGRIAHRKPRRQRTHAGPPLPIPDEPNATWTADFKGEFRTRDGYLCFPLTVEDGYTRVLLECRGMLRLDLETTMRRFRRLFQEYGLSERIRTDNGHPFSSSAMAGLSQLSVWWIELGIVPELIEPGRPQQNGRHERFHRTLKQDAASPPRANLRAQQARFDDFRRIYNFERPHEAIGKETPGALYRESPRFYSTRPEPLAYPGHFEVRHVAVDSTIRWKNRKVFVSSLLKHKDVGLEQIADQVWAVSFGPIKLGWLDEADYRIMDVVDRKQRRR